MKRLILGLVLCCLIFATPVFADGPRIESPSPYLNMLYTSTYFDYSKDLHDGWSRFFGYGTALAEGQEVYWIAYSSSDGLISFTIEYPITLGEEYFAPLKEKTDILDRNWQVSNNWEDGQLERLDDGSNYKIITVTTSNEFWGFIKATSFQTPSDMKVFWRAAFALEATGLIGNLELRNSPDICPGISYSF